MKPKLDLTVEEVRTLFDYSAEDGCLRWRAPRTVGQHHKIGDIAGFVHKGHGYRVIKIRGKGGYLAHRIVWVWVYGHNPHEIDHINMNRDDNRIGNLRLVTRSQNKCNTRARSDNRVGLKGVYKRDDRDCWRASITLNGVRKDLGAFATPEQAHAAYCEAAKSVHGEFARSV